MSGDFTTRKEVLGVYQKRAWIYEFAVYCCYLLDFPIGHYRRLVVEALALQPGDTVIEIGCGTGMNFPLLRERVGPEGRIIGVDISEAMLKRAEKRINAAGWTNVELLLSSAADYRFPDGVDAIIAFVWIFRSFGISLALFERTLWESIKRHLRNPKLEEFYFGLIFIASGEAP